ncbi:MAG: SDR family NAD(P)-dependent oxidoreductase [Acidimicrobiales bacterium]|nr:SDR family NAD(P)-dependent oxidoreductase [Acidimicrobiales bacterium]MEE3185945.1 SDR family NAD(P)-dependent oxidoreductase [Actinomycetota bacterium]
MDELRFDDRVALVTGAGGGLGREHALLLASRGAAVMVNDLGSPTMGGQDHDPSPAQAVVEEITAAGGVAIANSDSVASREGAESMVASALEEFGRLDILINNAGIIRNRTFLNIGEYEFEPVLDVHVKGCFFVTRPAYEHMKTVGYGRIINTSSGSGLFGSFGQTAYSAAKAAIYGFTRTLAIEGSRYGVHVNAIAPGALTRMTGDVLGDDGAMAEMTGLSGEDLVYQMGPHQVAPAVVYLAHESCSLNGETLSASGGRVGRAFMGVTKGIYEDDLTLETVAERIDEVCDEDGYLVPDNVDQEIELLLSHLNQE